MWFLPEENDNVNKKINIRKMLLWYLNYICNGMEMVDNNHTKMNTNHPIDVYSCLPNAIRPNVSLESFSR